MHHHLILLAEDEALIALDILSMLRIYSKIRVTRVLKGEELIKKAAELKPDIIISDIFLKDEITGIEAMKAVYSESEIPVLFISGNNVQLTEAKQLFPDSITLSKPFDGVHLINGLKKLNPIIFNGDLSLINSD
jgi:CheY-like chemotaxis protein